MTSNQTELSDELRFHLRELNRDLTTLCAQCEALQSTNPGEVQALRNRLAAIAAGVEHDATYHAPLVLKLIGAAAPAELSSLGSDEASSSVHRDLDSLTMAQVTPALESALQCLRNVLAAVRGDLAVVIAANSDVLNGAAAPIEAAINIARALVLQAHPAAQRALALAIHLHRLADPAAARADDVAAELATPERELRHPDARRLTRCLRCGSPLDAGDRTVDGSYCESCRTRWTEGGTEP